MSSCRHFHLGLAYTLAKQTDDAVDVRRIHSVLFIADVDY